jgi:hypothetical protein
MSIQSTLNSISKYIEEESVSWGELAQLQDIAQSHPRLFRDDPRLAEWAGITERKWRNL